MTARRERPSRIGVDPAMPPTGTVRCGEWTVAAEGLLWGRGRWPTLAERGLFSSWDGDGVSARQVLRRRALVELSRVGRSGHSTQSPWILLLVTSVARVRAASSHVRREKAAAVTGTAVAERAARNRRAWRRRRPAFTGDACNQGAPCTDARIHHHQRRHGSYQLPHPRRPPTLSFPPASKCRGLPPPPTQATQAAAVAHSSGVPPPRDDLPTPQRRTRRPTVAGSSTPSTPVAPAPSPLPNP